MNAKHIRLLSIAISEAKRFTEKAENALIVYQNDEYAWTGRKETAAAKRSSMDLTRSLSEYRNN